MKSPVGLVYKTTLKMLKIDFVTFFHETSAAGANYYHFNSYILEIMLRPPTASTRLVYIITRSTQLSRLSSAPNLNLMPLTINSRARAHIYIKMHAESRLRRLNKCTGCKKFFCPASHTHSLWRARSEAEESRARHMYIL